MHGSLTTGSWANINKGCPIRYRLPASGVAAFVFGAPPHDDFEFCIDTAALRELMKLGSEALAKLDAGLIDRQAEDDAEPGAAATHTGDLVTAGERST